MVGGGRPVKRKFCAQSEPPVAVPKLTHPATSITYPYLYTSCTPAQEAAILPGVAPSASHVQIPLHSISHRKILEVKFRKFLSPNADARLRTKHRF